MKKHILSLLFTILSIAAFAQSGSLAQSVYKSRVNDTTTTAFQDAITTAVSAGYGYVFWNNQAAIPHWDIYTDSGVEHVFSFSGGTGTGQKVWAFEVTDEFTNIGTGTAVRTFRMPYAMTLTGIRCELKTAQASGSIFTIDINESGSTILSTKITLDNTETTTQSAATPAVISDTSLADDAIITVDIDQIGNGSGVGCKCKFYGY